MLVKEWSKRCPFLTSRSSCSMDVGPPKCGIIGGTDVDRPHGFLYKMEEFSV